MHYQHLEIMLPTRRPHKSQLFWYIEIADDTENENANENENDNPYDSGILPLKVYSGTDTGTLGKLYHYTTDEVYGPRRQRCSRNLWIM